MCFVKMAVNDSISRERAGEMKQVGLKPKGKQYQSLEYWPLQGNSPSLLGSGGKWTSHRSFSVPCQRMRPLTDVWVEREGNSRVFWCLMNLTAFWDHWWDCRLYSHFTWGPERCSTENKIWHCNQSCIDTGKKKYCHRIMLEHRRYFIWFLKTYIIM